MTPNHTSAKARLFALYLGQDVFTYQAVSWTNVLTIKHLEPFQDDIIGQLQLRSIADLKDEEYETLCKLILHEWIDKVPVNKIEYGNRIANEINQDIGLGGQTWTTAWKAIDYLRSIGIARPFTVLEDGKPRTYSVEEQCELNWIQLNNSK